MAGFKSRADNGEPMAEEPGSSELSRLNKAFDAQWREWVRDGRGTAEAECLQLTEIIYALSDLQARAQEIRLDFLVYLLGMALQQAQAELRARESHDYPMPPAR